MIQPSKIQELAQFNFIQPASQGYTYRSERVENKIGQAKVGPTEGLQLVSTAPVSGNREIDHELVVRAQRGDKRAFGLLVDKYQRKLARLLSRMIRDQAEIEDVVQESFIKAYRALPNFRGDSAFYTWLYRIGINTAKKLLGFYGTPSYGVY